MKIKISELRQLIRECLEEAGACPPSGCVKQVKGKWRVISNKDGHLWPQTYDSKEAAEAAIAAYHVHH